MHMIGQDTSTPSHTSILPTVMAWTTQAEPLLYLHPTSHRGQGPSPPLPIRPAPTQSPCRSPYITPNHHSGQKYPLTSAGQEPHTVLAHGSLTTWARTLPHAHPSFHPSRSRGRGRGQGTWKNSRSKMRKIAKPMLGEPVTFAGPTYIWLKSEIFANCVDLQRMDEWDDDVGSFLAACFITWKITGMRRPIVC